MKKVLDFLKPILEKINSNPSRRNTVLTFVAIILTVCIAVSIINIIKTSNKNEILESGARIVVDCGIRVGFVVDKNFSVEEIYACEKKYEKYIKEIKYETDFVKAATHVLNCALDERYIYNVDYYALFYSVESKNPDMYQEAYVQLNDFVKEDGIALDQVTYCGVAITEYEPKIQRIAKRNKVPYSVAYACIELENANESLSARKLMKQEMYLISQLANNANGKDGNYFPRFLDEISRKNLSAL